MPEIDFPGHLNNLSDDQSDALNSLWLLLLRYPDAELMEEFWRQLAIDNPDILLLRFLRARKWNVEAACSMFLQALKWRQSFKVHQLMLQGERSIPQAILESGKGIYWGVDKHERLVAYFRPGLHDWRAQSLTDTCRHIVYQTEIGRRLFSPGAETLLVIFDLQGIRPWSLDVECLRFVISCFQDYYPESLGPCLITNAPWIFFSFYRMIKGWICEDVANKIRFLNNPSELKEYIDPEMLLQEYGGESPYRFEYIAPPLVDDKKPYDPAEVELLINNAKGLAQELTKRGKRDETLIRELSKVYRQIDALTSPLNLYHRIGVLDENSKSIKWRK